jgi:hypothetical protein
MKGLPKQEYLRLAAAAAFAVAMGFLESAVVIYLRMLYCPEGFGFPLKKLMSSDVLVIESSREFSTLVMLLGVAYLAASKLKDRFAYFLFTFAIWDLFYYVWLKVALNWPYSLQTSDVLFLLPWPWVGPVLAPVTASLTMILLALRLLNSKSNPNFSEWTLWFAGSFAILVTFLSDYGRLIAEGGYSRDFLRLAANPEFQRALSNHVPGNYDWVLFAGGEAVILAGIYAFHRRTR